MTKAFRCQKKHRCVLRLFYLFIFLLRAFVIKVYTSFMYLLCSFSLLCDIYENFSLLRKKVMRWHAYKDLLNIILIIMQCSLNGRSSIAWCVDFGFDAKQCKYSIKRVATLDTILGNLLSFTQQQQIINEREI